MIGNSNVNINDRVSSGIKGIIEVLNHNEINMRERMIYKKIRVRNKQIKRIF